jgi:hypothetical protein
MPHNQHKLDGLRFLGLVNRKMFDNQYIMRKNVVKSVNLCKPCPGFSTRYALILTFSQRRRNNLPLQRERAWGEGGIITFAL